MRAMWMHATLALTVAWAAVGCGGSSQGEAAEGLIGPDGGALSSADGIVRVVVPAGALDDRVAITIAETSPVAGTVGPVYDIRPTGTRFVVPAELSFRVAGLQDGEMLSIVRIVDDSFEMLDGRAYDMEAGVLSATTMHLSLYGLRRAGEEATNAGMAVGADAAAPDPPGDGGTTPGDAGAASNAGSRDAGAEGAGSVDAGFDSGSGRADAGAGAGDGGTADAGAAESDAGAGAANNVGARCSLDTDCTVLGSGPATCRTETQTGWPGGYCSAVCEPDQQSCGPGTVCQTALAGGAFCLKQCEGASDCRPDQVCEELLGDMVCQGAECADDLECSEAGYCRQDWNGRWCRTTATLCGNGVVEPGEECDDGNAIQQDGCLTDCTLDPPPGWSCLRGLFYEESQDIANPSCHCECGGRDQDCSNPDLPVVGCSIGTTCINDTCIAD